MFHFSRGVSGPWFSSTSFAVMKLGMIQKMRLGTSSRSSLSSGLTLGAGGSGVVAGAGGETGAGGGGAGFALGWGGGGGSGWGGGGGVRVGLGEEGKRGEQRKEQSCPSPRAELGVHSKMTS